MLKLYSCQGIPVPLKIESLKKGLWMLKLLKFFCILSTQTCRIDSPIYLEFHSLVCWHIDTQILSLSTLSSSTVKKMCHDMHFYCTCNFPQLMLLPPSSEPVTMEYFDPSKHKHCRLPSSSYPAIIEPSAKALLHFFLSASKLEIPDVSLK